MNWRKAALLMGDDNTVASKRSFPLSLGGREERGETIGRFGI